MKKFGFVRAFLFFILFSVTGIPCFGSQTTEAQPNNDAVVNVTGGGRSLRAILQEVAVQSGYRIEISESLLDKKVNGKFMNTDIESFFNRALKGSDIFQIIDQKNKVIKLFVTTRTQERVLVVDVRGNEKIESHWLDSGLDGEPGKTNRELLQAREDVFNNYKPAEHELDGESGKTAQDLLSEREAVYREYDPDVAELDGEPGKMSGALLKAREDVSKKYNPAHQYLDGNPGKTTQDLLDSRAEYYKTYNPGQQTLDGEPGKTFQDLLDERNQAYGSRSR